MALCQDLHYIPSLLLHLLRSPMQANRSPTVVCIGPQLAPIFRIGFVDNARWRLSRRLARAHADPLVTCVWVRQAVAKATDRWGRSFHARPWHRHWVQVMSALGERDDPLRRQGSSADCEWFRIPTISTVLRNLGEPSGSIAARKLTQRELAKRAGTRRDTREKDFMVQLMPPPASASPKDSKMYPKEPPRPIQDSEMAPQDPSGSHVSNQGVDTSEKERPGDPQRTPRCIPRSRHDPCKNQKWHPWA